MHKDNLLTGLDAGDVGVWFWSVQSGDVQWSPNLEAIHDLEPGRFDGTFSFFEKDIHPDDRDGVMATIHRVMREGGAYRVEYRLPPKPGVPVKWLEARGRALLAEDGRLTGMTGICQDITPRKAAELEVATRARQREAIARLRALALRDHGVQELFDAAAVDVACMLEVTFCELLEFVPSRREFVLRAGTGWDDGLAGSLRMCFDAGTQAGYTLNADGPVIVDDLARESRFRGHGLLTNHGAVSGVSVVVAGDTNEPFGVLGAYSAQPRSFTPSDIDAMQGVANILAGAVQRDRANERQMLLIRELRHRVGNLISLIMSLFKNSIRGATSIEDFASKYEARILSLSRAHGLISERGWAATGLGKVVREVLEPYLDRIDCTGESVYLSADTAFYLSLALHELATNAVKYGALSVAGGRVTVRWRVLESGVEPSVLLEWIESDGPAVTAPGTHGFGTKLVDALIRRQIRGEIDADFAPAGLYLRMTLPLKPAGRDAFDLLSA